MMRLLIFITILLTAHAANSNCTSKVSTINEFAEYLQELIVESDKVNFASLLKKQSHMGTSYKEEQVEYVFDATKSNVRKILLGEYTKVYTQSFKALDGSETDTLRSAPRGEQGRTTRTVA